MQYFPALMWMGRILGRKYDWMQSFWGKCFRRAAYAEQSRAQRWIGSLFWFGANHSECGGKGAIVTAMGVEELTTEVKTWRCCSPQTGLEGASQKSEEKGHYQDLEGRFRRDNH